MEQAEGAAASSRRITCLLWRPGGSIIRDGGFRRTYAILESMHADVLLTVVDRYPSFLPTNQFHRVVEYRIPPWVGWLEARAAVIGGLIEACLAFTSLLVRGGIELRRTRERIVYVPTSEIPWVTFAGALLAWLFRGRLVLTNQNTRIELANKAAGLVGWILWRIHARADQVIAISAAIADELRSVGVAGNVSVNPNGFERRAGVNRRATPQHGGIYVGRIEPTKGIEDLLDAWLIVCKDFPQADLRLVGYANSTNQARFAQTRATLGLDRAVEMIGVVPDGTKWTLLEESRLCMFLSYVEGWGFVPIEALSIGLPVIVYDLPCYKESLRGLDGVFTVALGDTTAAAAQAARLLAMTEAEYAALSDRIRSSFHYPDWSQIASAELEIIKGKQL